MVIKTKFFFILIVDGEKRTNYHENLPTTTVNRSDSSSIGNFANWESQVFVPQRYDCALPARTAACWLAHAHDSGNAVSPRLFPLLFKVRPVHHSKEDLTMREIQNRYYGVVVYSKATHQELGRDIFMKLPGSLEKIEGCISDIILEFVPPPPFANCVNNFVEKIKRQIGEDVVYTCMRIR